MRDFGCQRSGRSAILPGGLFYIIGKFGELSYDIKKVLDYFRKMCLNIIKYVKYITMFNSAIKFPNLTL